MHVKILKLENMEHAWTKLISEAEMVLPTVPT